MITIRRGGSLTDENHQLLALWAAGCAEHVLGLFDEVRPDDPRPHEAVEASRAWARGEVPMMRARAVGGHAMEAARTLSGAARFAAYASGQAACVGHVAEHDLGAAAYAIKAVRSAHPNDPDAVLVERAWQRERIPGPVRELVLEDQRRRNDVCWSAFHD